MSHILPAAPVPLVWRELPRPEPRLPIQATVLQSNPAPPKAPARPCRPHLKEKTPFLPCTFKGQRPPPPPFFSASLDPATMNQLQVAMQSYNQMTQSPAPTPGRGLELFGVAMDRLSHAGPTLRKLSPGPHPPRKLLKKRVRKAGVPHRNSVAGKRLRKQQKATQEVLARIWPMAPTPPHLVRTAPPRTPPPHPSNGDPS